MEYNFLEIEKKWQKEWKENQTYKTELNTDKPKFYVLDMFPYPSGAGLHVGHPLGYIASDIYSRYKTMKGFNVLHPMGYDAFGLPAEQYAIQTGQHPAITTEQNIKRYREQLDKIGFSYDWSRELKTCDATYYKWTQWAFIQMFEHYYDTAQDKARPISELVAEFERNGNQNVSAAHSCETIFTATEWANFSEAEKAELLFDYRLAYLSETMVNWCEALGTVLANDEVKEGISVRGGHPVTQKKMKQWQLRVSAYAERLLTGLEDLEWSHSLKEIQKNWIGKSQGAQLRFDIKNSEQSIEIFTTRADTVFGVTFMVLAPESELVQQLTTPDQQQAVNEYLEFVKTRTERERMSEVDKVTGVFTGAYARHPFTGEAVPIWISDYVLIGYGTGAIMAVPAHDSRDYAFAKQFDLPIIPLIEGADVSQESFDAKEGKVINSDFLNGLDVKEAIVKAIDIVEERGLGERKVNYRLRDAIFSRQRYWGEPFPIYFENGIAKTVPLEDLPVTLPSVDKYLPTADGQPPLARAEDWTYKGHPMEYSTMPGFAGSSAYFLRYMDPHNEKGLVSEEANQYWQDVDLYIGGTEHATGHLVYSRFWNKFLFDIGHICKEEPFKKLINQGMIQGRSNFVYRIKGTNEFVSYNLRKQYDTTPLHVDVNIVDNDILDTERFKQWQPEYKDASFILEDGKYICGAEVEKMSKSMYNVVNPDDIVQEYGADTLRLYEMFLGPLEQSKPWNTNGIDGVHRFLKKLWRLFYCEDGGGWVLRLEHPNEAELKALHTLIKKAEQDINNFSFNTTVSAFMICVNELGNLKCNKLDVLEPLLKVLAPFAPHIAEELWHTIGHTSSITLEDFPEYNEEYLVEDQIEYPVSFNGKMRFKMNFAADATADQVQEEVLAHELAQKWLTDKQVRKFIFVPKKIINVVVG